MAATAKPQPTSAQSAVKTNNIVKVAMTSATPFHGEAPAESAFTITATQPSRPPRALKYGDTFVVLDSRGNIGGASGGLFHRDTRHLSRLELRVNDGPPLLLGSNVRDDNSAFFVDLTNPDLMDGQHIVMEKDRVHILRTIFLWRDTAYQRLGVRNYGDEAIDLRLAIHFENDFADLFEVRGARRNRRGTASATLHGDDRVILSYNGLDGQVRRTALNFDPPPDQLTTSSAAYELHLKPGEMRPLFIAVSCDRTSSPPLPFLRGLIAARREMRESTREQTSVQTSNERFNAVLCRSAADLAMLMTDTPQGRYPYAGIPWYSTTFGRDGLITALQMLWWSPDVARGVLRRLAAYQATTTDPLADAQPGKILHEMRWGEMAALREVPFGLYYGSVDATPLFVLLTGLYLERTGDTQTIVELWPNIEAALAWIDGPGDPDRDGFVEISAPASKASPIRAGKIRTTRSFMPMGVWPRARSRLSRCRATSMPPNAWPRVARGGLSSKLRRNGSMTKRAASPNASRPHSGVRTWKLMRWRSMARKNHAACSHRTPARCCSPALPTRTAPGALPRSCCNRASSPAGAFAQWQKTRCALIRCRTTTVRSGRTTMP